MPAMPEHLSLKQVKEGILKGMYKYKKSGLKKSKLKAQLLGSGAILNEALKAQEILENEYKVAADVWSVTSYKELRQNGLEVDRQNLLHPKKKAAKAYVTECLENEEGVFVAASDYMKVLPDIISKWSPKPIYSLGTEGFGRSEDREALRDFFEVDARYIVLATLSELVRVGDLKADVLDKAIKDLKINTKKKNPLQD